MFKDPVAPIILNSNVKIFNQVTQKTLAELYNCADIYIGKSRVESLWLTPIEAMFCDIPIDVTKTGIFYDWRLLNLKPRNEAIKKGLDQETMIKHWEKLVKFK